MQSLLPKCVSCLVWGPHTSTRHLDAGACLRLGTEAKTRTFRIQWRVEVGQVPPSRAWGRPGVSVAVSLQESRRGWRWENAATVCPATLWCRRH